MKTTLVILLLRVMILIVIAAGVAAGGYYFMSLPDGFDRADRGPLLIIGVITTAISGFLYRHASALAYDREQAFRKSIREERMAEWDKDK